MNTAMAQPRKIANLLPVRRLDLLLVVKTRRERRGVGFLALLPQHRERAIEQRLHLYRARGAIVDRIGEADHQVAGEHHARDRCGLRLEYPLPRRGQVRAAAAVERIDDDRGDEKPQQRIGGEYDRRHSSLMRGSTSVYERSVSRSPTM